MTNRIMVIGSNSFSGSHFAAYAAALGNEVIGISRSDRPSNEFLLNIGTMRKGLNIYLKKLI